MSVRAAQKMVAVFWLWVGRFLLVASPIFYAAFLQANSVWSASSSADDSGSWVDIASVIWILVFGMGLPFFFLPTTSTTLISQNEQVLEAETILGRRSLDVGSLTARSFEIPGNGWGWEVDVLRDASGHRLFVCRSGIWDILGGQTMPETAQWEELPEIVGWLVMLGWIALGFVFFVVALLPVP